MRARRLTSDGSACYITSSSICTETRVRCDVNLSRGEYVVIPVLLGVPKRVANSVGAAASAATSGAAEDKIVLALYSSQAVIVKEVRLLQ